MNISLLSTIDGSTFHMRNKVIPMAIEALEEDSPVDLAPHESTLSRLRSKGFYSSDEHVILSISFDPKTCGIPMEYCGGDCIGCNHNPLTSLLNPYIAGTQYIITRKDTIDTMLDTITLLAKTTNRGTTFRSRKRARTRCRG